MCDKQNARELREDMDMASCNGDTTDGGLMNEDDPQIPSVDRRIGLSKN